jgi:uncharacterized membrane protein YkoI
MKITTLVSLALAATLFVSLSACVSRDADQARLEARAKITRAEAQKIALGKVPNGVVKEGGLEEEHGQLIWSFDISSPGTKEITEVAVDAISGQIIAVDQESPEKEKAEKAEDAKKK